MTSDKNPLVIMRSPQSLFRLQCQDGHKAVSSLHVQTMLFQVYCCFFFSFFEGVLVCLPLHTLLQPAVDVAHFLACVSVLVYPHQCWLFPQEQVCVLIEAIS